MGDLRDPQLPAAPGGLSRRGPRPPASSTTSRTSTRRTGGVGECRYLGTCGVCPVSIGHQPGNTDPHRIPDFQCAYNLVSLKYRERFPFQPTALERITGDATLPEDLGGLLDLVDPSARSALAAAASGREPHA